MIIINIINFWHPNTLMITFNLIAQWHAFLFPFLGKFSYVSYALWTLYEFWDWHNTAIIWLPKCVVHQQTYCVKPGGDQYAIKDFYLRTAGNWSGLLTLWNESSRCTADSIWPIRYGDICVFVSLFWTVISVRWDQYGLFFTHSSGLHYWCRVNHSDCEILTSHCNQ